MQTKEQLIGPFKAFALFAESLLRLDEHLWTEPLAPGKWSVRDIISHITLWDNYFLEHAVAKVVQNEPLTLRHLNYDDFNAGAVEYAASHGTQKSLIAQTLTCRNQLLEERGVDLQAQ